MGTNKALMHWKGKRLAQYGIDLVTALNLPVFLSVKQADRDTFQKVFQGCGIIPDENGLRLEGPARGILSAHLLLPQEDWMVLSCDMPLLTPSMGRDLLRSHGAHPEAEASLFSSQGIYEPLFGIYTSTALGHWLRQDETGAWSSSSMKYLLSRVRVRAIPAKDRQIPFFLNANHPSDLDAGVREV